MKYQHEGVYTLHFPNGPVRIRGQIDDRDRLYVFLIEHNERSFRFSARENLIIHMTMSPDHVRKIVTEIAYAFANEEECPYEIKDGILLHVQPVSSRPWPVREKKSWTEYL